MNARTAGQEWGRVHKQRPPAMFGLLPPILENYLITRLHIDKPTSMSDSHISGAKKTAGHSRRSSRQLLIAAQPPDFERITATQGIGALDTRSPDFHLIAQAIEAWKLKGRGIESPSLSGEMQLTDPRPASSIRRDSEEAGESEWGEHRKYKDPKTSLARAQIGGVHLALGVLTLNINASITWCKENNKPIDEWCKAHKLSNERAESLTAVIRKKLFPVKEEKKEDATSDDATSDPGWKLRSIDHMSANDVLEYVKPLQGSFGIHDECLQGSLATEAPWVGTNWKVLETAAERGAEHLDWGT